MAQAGARWATPRTHYARKAASVRRRPRQTTTRPSSDPWQLPPLATTIPTTEAKTSPAMEVTSDPLHATPAHTKSAWRRRLHTMGPEVGAMWGAMRESPEVAVTMMLTSARGGRDEGGRDRDQAAMMLTTATPTPHHLRGAPLAIRATTTTTWTAGVGSDTSGEGEGPARGLKMAGIEGVQGGLVQPTREVVVPLWATRTRRRVGAGRGRDTATTTIMIAPTWPEEPLRMRMGEGAGAPLGHGPGMATSMGCGAAKEMPGNIIPHHPNKGVPGPAELRIIHHLISSKHWFVVFSFRFWRTCILIGFLQWSFLFLVIFTTQKIKILSATPQ